MLETVPRRSCSILISVVLGIIPAICAQAYVHSERRPGSPFLRANPDHIAIVVSDQTRAGLSNLDDGVTITSDSSPTAAILAALNRWNEIPGSALHFDNPVSVAEASAKSDEQTLITFADTPANRSIAFNAVAVTVLISTPSGNLTDTDIVFNPAFPFSTTLQPNTFDIEGTLVHELGHAIGMGHSGSVSSTMFASTGTASPDLRSLTIDDSSFAQGVYPALGPQSAGALIIDTKFNNGLSAAGVLVVAIDASSNTLLTGLSNNLGRAIIRGVPPGNYIVYAEPVNGPAEFGQFSQNIIQTSISTTFLGSADAPALLAVQPAVETKATLTLRPGVDLMNIDGAGAAPLGGFVENDFGAIVAPGGEYIFELYGEGLDDPSITLNSISFLGSGVTVSGPLEIEDDGFFGFFQLLRFQIRIDPNASEGSLSAMVRAGEQTALFTSALEIIKPTPIPSFTSDGVVNAASFASGAALSPGGIFSIFGTELGPPVESSGFFDPLSGGLIEMMQGVCVLINERPAPLFYVGPGQINAQAPADLQPGFVSVRVLRDDVSSPSVFVPVAETAPGVFLISGSNRAVVLNQNGTLNSPANPAARGSVITFYVTGAGIVDPSLATGQPAPIPGSLHHVAASVDARIGGQTTSVEFAGAAPQFVGLIQVNVRIPLTAPVGDDIELRLRAAQALSQAGARLAIR